MMHNVYIDLYMNMPNCSQGLYKLGTNIWTSSHWKSLVETTQIFSHPNIPRSTKPLSHFDQFTLWSTWLRDRRLLVESVSMTNLS
jgi:hypothetical protein